jgi:hypothetical protein
MSVYLILIVMCIYATIGIIELSKGNLAFSLMWFGYSISNIALALMAYKEGL